METASTSRTLEQREYGLANVGLTALLTHGQALLARTVGLVSEMWRLVDVKMSRRVELLSDSSGAGRRLWIPKNPCGDVEAGGVEVRRGAKGRLQGCKRRGGVRRVLEKRGPNDRLKGRLHECRRKSRSGNKVVKSFIPYGKNPTEIQLVRTVRS